MNTATVTRSVVQLLDETPDVDNQSTFEALWSLFAELRQKIDARFALTLDPSVGKFQSYSNANGEGQGSIDALTGPEMDWMIHSWIGTPQTSFTNMHLTAWLGPHIRVPHLWMAMGTIPDIFVFLDYGPRADLSVDTAYLDRYYTDVNAGYMQVLDDPELPSFVTQDLCTRQYVSPTGVCLGGVKSSPAMIQRLSQMAHAHVDRWLSWVDEAEAVPFAEREALAARDLYVRRTIAERDPANAVATRLYGDEMTHELVRSLWGGDRILSRPQLYPRDFRNDPGIGACELCGAVDACSKCV